MALTCPNGHVNDEGNRFCEQCGAPLQQAQANVAQPVAQATMPAGATSSTCPVCGQENVPGTAFCDNCGAALPPPMPASEESASAPADPALTSAASAPADPALTSAASATGGGSTTICAQCGTENDPSNRFCDNCGAQVSDADAAAQLGAGQSAAQPEAPAGGSDSNAQIIDIPAVAPDQSTAPAADATPPAEDSSSAAIDPTLTAPEAPPASATADTSADRQRLEEEIRTQQQVVGQLEQMQSNFGAATPAAVVQGLEEAHKRLAQAEADLQDLTGGAATSAAPAPEAAPAQPAPSQPAQPAQSATAIPVQSPAAQPAQPAAPAIPAQSASSAAPTIVPSTGGTNQLPPVPAQPQASGPRFVARDGSALSLPRTGAEIVIGRDDPISGIHPDVDLTPHGGEAGGVSRRHAVLRESNGQWLLTDLDSTNYTRIDGNRITPDTPTPLNDGARVQFGRLEFDFHAS